MKKLRIKLLFSLLMFAFLFCDGQEIKGIWKFEEITVDTDFSELREAMTNEFYKAGFTYLYINFKEGNEYNLADSFMDESYLEGKYFYNEDELIIDND